MAGKPSGGNPHKSSANYVLRRKSQVQHRLARRSCRAVWNPLRGNLLIFDVSQRWCCLFLNDRYLRRASISCEYIYIYIVLCMYTSTLLYLVFLCMYIHIYIYTYVHIYIYAYMHIWSYMHIIYTCYMCLVYSCNTLNTWLPTKYRSHFHPKTACKMSFVLCFAALPHCANRRRCHCHTSSFKQMLSCLRSYECVQFLQKGFNHFYRFLSSKPFGYTFEKQLHFWSTNCIRRHIRFMGLWRKVDTLQIPFFHSGEIRTCHQCHL